MSDVVRQPITEKLREMRARGIEQTIPFTMRIVRVRTLDPTRIMQWGKVPDILTPLVAKAIYEEVSDAELLDFTKKPRDSAKEALEVLQSLNVVATDVLMHPKVVEGQPKDDSEITIEELTLAERRWIFRLGLAPAEVLVTFRYEPVGDVGDLAGSNDLSQDAEPDTRGEK